MSERSSRYKVFSVAAAGGWRLDKAHQYPAHRVDPRSRYPHYFELNECFAFDPLNSVSHRRCLSVEKEIALHGLFCKWIGISHDETLFYCEREHFGCTSGA
ncbi:hypothetical protein [Mesorhizobium escarrei]|uniref:hypothetical protein n=1 Tax=Mesorhizobium escarrei TaxID=666018 RepID=UPI0020A73EFB|nr:hypothetical protein [Mesorhizobium escarrei]